MRIKKAFTLAEILIVLMVIGVIATMTVPSLMKGVNEATYKTAYKKAYNAVTNIAAVEKISGQLPVNADEFSALNFFSSLNSNLSVKEYFTGPAENNLKAGDGAVAQTLMTQDDTYLKAIVKAGSKEAKYGTTKGGAELSAEITQTQASPWIVTEDSLAYSVIPAKGGACGTKADIMAAADEGAAVTASCLVVLIDVNGLAKGPNKFEAQVINGVASNAKMNQLEGDRYYIFIGNDGVSPGPKSTTVSGRLMSDMK